MAGVTQKVGMSPVKRRQLILLLALVVVVAAIALLAGVLGTPSKKEAPRRAPDATRKVFGAQGEQINNADFWRTQEGARVSTLEKELADMKARIKASEKHDEEEKKAATESAERKAAEDKRVSEEKKQRDDALLKQAPPGRPGVPLPGELGAPNIHPPNNEARPIVRIEMSGLQSPATKALVDAERNATLKNDRSAGGRDAGDVRGDSNTAETYIPAGAFMRGVLLSGLDAPTGGQAQQNPHPVLIEVMDMASFPNKFKADYKNCRLIANGAGDLSSERAFIRLDRMSCITEEGGAIDVAVKGFVADSSGKSGVRGRLVSKQGAVLANALVAGVASGIGNAFANGAMTTSTSPLGTTTTVNNGTQAQLQAGIGTGIGTALNQLSHYYIQLAEKMFPIIEVDAGLPVDIVFTKGFTVARRGP